MASSKKAKPVGTAILAVYNAESTVRECIETLRNQTVQLEIIAVDDGSTDGTQEILNEYADVIVLKQNHAGPAIARNYGVSQAAADIVLFVDADMSFDKNYAAELIAPIVEGKEKGTYTVEERVKNWDNIWARCWNWQEGWEDGKRFPPDPPEYGTDFRAIRKSDFESVGGFDDIGYTDTWSLGSKLKRKPRATRAVCYHSNPSTLQAVYRQARWSAMRTYKLGFVGSLYALLRTSAPVSFIAAAVKSVAVGSASFFIFKLVYDWGRFVGILTMILTGDKRK